MDAKNQILDVAIIGGGPAGSTAATYLARMGYSVTVLEKEKFPREHVGESLLPFCYEVFEELGVLDEMKKRFVRKPGVRFVGTDGETQNTWCFGDVIKDPSALSFHVIRAEFDDLLLKNSAKNGAIVREEMRVKKVTHDTPDKIAQIEAVDTTGDTHTFQARFVIDASGQQTFLSRQNKWKESIEDLDRVALSTHWTGAEFVDSLAEGLLQIVYLGGEKKGWIWVIPVSKERLSIGVVLNNSYVKAQRKNLESAGTENWREALYRQELFSSPFLAKILANAEIAQPLMLNGNYSYFSQKKYGDNFAIIGDAASFLDPIFASGVYLAMNSGRMIAKAIDQKFSVSETDQTSTIDAAYQKIEGAYVLMDKLIRLFYDPEAINFAQLGHAFQVFDSKLKFAYSLTYYLIAGDFFNNHEKYLHLLDRLRDPKVVEAYKRVYIDRPQFETSVTCGVEKEKIFATSIAE